MRTAVCRCGAAELAVEGEPILTAVCYCDSCQLAAQAIEALDGAAKVMDAAGGTPLSLFRKDRMRVVKGEDRLEDFRLLETSPTRRVVATCCDTMMYLDFQKGHWFSIHRDGFAPDERPPVDMRIQTRYVAEGLTIPGGGKAYKKFPLRFIGKLVIAQFAMLLGR